MKRNAKIEVIKQLLKAGCSVDRADEKLNRPLHCAAHYGNTNTCRFLINAKAHVQGGNHLGRTPLHFAALGEAAPVARLLLGSGAAADAATRPYLFTPLHIAAANDEVGVVFLLLAHRTTEAGRLDRDGTTALNIASRAGHDAVAKLLRSHRVHSQGWRGRLLRVLGGGGV